MNCLEEVMTAAEAAEKWGKAPITVQQACSGYAKAKPKFLPTEARKAGRNLTNGPGKLCQAMAITREENTLDLTSSCLYIAHPEEEVPFTVAVSPRIHIDYAVHGKYFPWRFYIQDNPYVSKV